MSKFDKKPDSFDQGRKPQDDRNDKNNNQNNGYKKPQDQNGPKGGMGQDKNKGQNPWEDKNKNKGKDDCNSGTCKPNSSKCTSDECEDEEGGRDQKKNGNKW